MKFRMLQFAGVLAVLAVVGKFYAVPAIAQVRAALTQDRDQRGRNIYQSQGVCFQVKNPCQITFPAVPVGQRLIIEHASTINIMQSATALNGVQLRNGFVYQFLLPTAAPGNYPGEFYFVSNDNVLLSYDAGQIPLAVVFATTSATFTSEVAISGYMITIP
jgi:hypothetical protein